MSRCLLSTMMICCMLQLNATQFIKDKKVENDFVQVSKEPGALIFNPPTGWGVVQTKLPPSVKVMVVGKGDHVIPPSINLAVENFRGTIKDYLQKVKEINEAEGTDWKDLGVINTSAGTVNLSQVDTPSEWGTIRLMHAILIKNGKTYILTAAASKDEFSKFYQDFFKSFRSLRFNDE